MKIPSAIDGEVAETDSMGMDEQRTDERVSDITWELTELKVEAEERVGGFAIEESAVGHGDVG